MFHTTVWCFTSHSYVSRHGMMFHVTLRWFWYHIVMFPVTMACFTSLYNVSVMFSNGNLVKWVLWLHLLLVWNLNIRVLFHPRKEFFTLFSSYSMYEWLVYLSIIYNNILYPLYMTFYLFLFNNIWGFIQLHHRTYWIWMLDGLYHFYVSGEGIMVLSEVKVCYY